MGPNFTMKSVIFSDTIGIVFVNILPVKLFYCLGNSCQPVIDLWCWKILYRVVSSGVNRSLVKVGDSVLAFFWLTGSEKVFLRDIGVLKVSYRVKQCLITTIRNIIDWKFSNTISMEANTKYNVSNYLYSFSPSCIYFEFSSAPCGISYLFDGRVY